VSAATDANDRAALEVISRHPGVKRRHWSVNTAATVRLVNARLVAPPTTSGRLYLTDAGRAELAGGPPCGIGECGCHTGAGTP
jgi:hypothetical protein